MVPRGLGTNGRHQPEYKRLCEPGHRRTLLLQGPRARFSRIDRLRQHLYSRAATHNVAKDSVRARRRSGQGTVYIYIYLSIFDGGVSFGRLNIIDGSGRARARARARVIERKETTRVIFLSAAVAVADGDVDVAVYRELLHGTAGKVF